MSLLSSDVLLGGVRVGASLGSTTYLPANKLLDKNVLNGYPDAEFAIWVTGIDPATNFALIASGSVCFRYSVNLLNLTKFGYSDFDKRWDSLPGSTPSNLGVPNNSVRLSLGYIVEGLLDDSPIRLTCGLPALFDFNIIFVNSDSDFTDPPSRSVQVSRTSWCVNFSSVDLNNSTFSKTDIYWFSQSSTSFSDIAKNAIPVKSLDADFYLSPIPGPGWTPSISFGSRIPLEVVDTLPLSGQIQYLGGGSYRLSLADLKIFSSEKLVYRGLSRGPIRFEISNIGNSKAFWPNVAASDPRFLGLTDPGKYLFALFNGSKYFYLNTVILNDDPVLFLGNSPNAYIDPINGNLYISNGFGSGSIIMVDLDVDLGVGSSFRFTPSILNQGTVAKYTDFSEWASRTTQVVDSIRANRIIITETLTESFPYSFSLANGSTGGRTGILYNLDTFNGSGFGYSFDSLNKTLILAQRSTEKVVVNSDSVKLLYSAYIDTNYKITDVNGVDVPSSGYEFDASQGKITFIKSYGVKNDRLLSIDNQVVGKDITFNDISLLGFAPSHISIGLVFTEVTSIRGTSVSVSQDLGVKNGASITLYRNLLRASRDSLKFSPVPPTNFHIFKSSNQLGPFQELELSDYSVLEDPAQVRLSTSSDPDTFYKVVYQTADGGSLKTKDEYLNCRITNEKTSSTSSALEWLFNPDGRALGNPGVLDVVVNGSSIEAGKYKIDGNKIILSVDPLSKTVMISYNVLNGQGGFRTFTLSSSTMTLNNPKFYNGASELSFPGDYRSQIVVGGITAFSDLSLYSVKSVSYDSTSNTTEVVLYSALNGNKDNSIAFLNNPYPPDVETVLATVSVAIRVNKVHLSGLVSLVKNGILYLNDDPYLISSVEFESDYNRTRVFFYTGTISNYKSARVKYTRLPVINNGLLNIPYTPVPGIEVKVFSYGDSEGLDISTRVVTNGNTLTFKDDVGHNSTLLAFETTHVPDLKEFQFTGNHQISPDKVNRIYNQRLLGYYKVHTPDSFSFRTYTASSFSSNIPVLSSGGRISGKGNPSYMYQLASLELADVVLSQFVNYFNDFANYYESLRENFAGLPVGGGSYKFRYNGDLNHTKRDEYWQVLNDIDDEIYIRTKTFLFLRSRRIYSLMNDYHRFSRLFSTHSDVLVKLNDQTRNDGSVVGSVGLTDITGYTSISVEPSRGFVKERTDFNSFLIINGDPNKQVSSLVVGQSITFYSGDQVSRGTLTIVSLSPVAGFESTGLTNCVVSGGESIPLLYNQGYFIGPIDSYKYTSFHIDSQSGDIITEGETSFLSIVLQEAIPPNSCVRLGVSYMAQNTMPNDIPVLTGGEYKDDGSLNRVDSLHQNEYSYLLKERVLYNGGFQNRFSQASVTADNAFVSSMAFLNVGSEISFLQGPNKGKRAIIKTVLGGGSFEVTEHTLNVDAVSRYIFNSKNDKIDGVVALAANTIRCSLDIPLGTVVYFSSGPNADIHATVMVKRGNSYTLNRSLNSSDSTPRSLMRVGPGYDFDDLYEDYSSVYFNQTAVNATSMNKYGVNDSTWKLFIGLSQSMGPKVTDVTLACNGNKATLDSSSMLPENSFIYVGSGPNQGLYWVESQDSNVITVQVSGDFHPFPQPISVSATAYQLYSFFDQSLVAVLSRIWYESFSFWGRTEIYFASIDPTQSVDRASVVRGRIDEVSGYWDAIRECLATTSNLYDVRKTWVIQRTDKVSGIAMKKQKEIEILASYQANLKMELVRQSVLQAVQLQFGGT